MALLIASVAALFWPGVPMYDTVAQYRQVLGGPVDDWHPPVMVRLWQLLHWRVSVRVSLCKVSWLRPPLRSTVTASARQPAFSARLTITSVTSCLLVA